MIQNQFNKLSKDERYILLSVVIDDKRISSVMAIVCQELYGNCKSFWALNMIVDQGTRKKAPENLCSAGLRELQDPEIAPK